MASKKYWLVKTEPDVYPMSQLKKEKVTQWTDVRNYQARNNLQEMKAGDEVLVYHSNAEPNAIHGVAIVERAAYPDPGQFDKKSEYYDSKATKTEPRWYAPDLRFKKEFPNPLPSEAMKSDAILKNMMLFKNSRLSVQPVTEAEFKQVLKIAE